MKSKLIFSTFYLSGEDKKLNMKYLKEDGFKYMKEDDEMVLFHDMPRMNVGEEIYINSDAFLITSCCYDLTKGQMEYELKFA